MGKPITKVLIEKVRGGFSVHNYCEFPGDQAVFVDAVDMIRDIVKRFGLVSRVRVTEAELDEPLPGPEAHR
jgi:hypothetical protein